MENINNNEPISVDLAKDADGLSVRPYEYRFQIKDAEKYLRWGLQYLFGEKYTWLAEYGKIAEWMSDNKGKSLLLIGGCGVGKSVIGCRIIPHIIKKVLGKTFEPISAPKFARIKELPRKMIWYIDDLGTERRVRDFGTEVDNFTDLFEDLESYGGIAVITTNLNSTEFRERYGDRNYDRIRSRFCIVAINHESMRQ